jgi:two-component system, LytTR family, response regulator
MKAKEISIPTNKGLKFFVQENIIRVEARSNYCKIFFVNERPLVVAKVLQWFEERLAVEIFCRIHPTHLVNRLYIIDAASANTNLVLSNGDIVQISRRKKIVFKKILHKKTDNLL